VRQWFDKPKDGQLLRVLPLLATRFDHCAAGDPFESCLRNTRADGPNETGSEQVAGGFTSNQSYLHFPGA
jgi:hypothetical protein